jgi:LemA protein
MAIISAVLTVAIGLLAVILIGYIVGIYNSFVRLKNNIERAWSNIDVLLKQRHDEVNNLMNSVKGYMKFEKSVHLQVAKARTAFLNAGNVSEKARADDMMEATLKSIFAVAESYPKLKASENFLRFQKRITELEDHISDRREFYNDSVNTYNIRLEQIPYVLIARLFNYSKKQLFRADAAERQAVTADF